MKRCLVIHMLYKISRAATKDTSFDLVSHFYLLLFCSSSSQTVGNESRGGLARLHCQSNVVKEEWRICPASTSPGGT